MNLRHIMILVVVFATVVSSLVYVMQVEFKFYDVSQEYGEEYGNITSSISKTQSLVESMMNKTETAEGITTNFSFNMITGLIYQAIKLPFAMIGDIGNLIFILGATIGIPPIVMTGLLVLIMITILSLILGLMFNKDV